MPIAMAMINQCQHHQRISVHIFRVFSNFDERFLDTMMGVKRRIVLWFPMLLLSYTGLSVGLNAHDSELDSCAGICQIHGVHILFEEEEKDKQRKVDRPASRRRIQKSHDNRSTLRRNKEDTWMFSCRTLWDELLDGQKNLPMHEIELLVSTVAQYGEEALEDGEWSLCCSEHSLVLQGDTTFIPINSSVQDPTEFKMISTRKAVEWGQSKHFVRGGNFRHLDSRSQRHLSQRTGTKSVLVVRLKTSQGQAPASSVGDMKKAIFGPTPVAEQAQGLASVAFQYSQMSHGQLTLEPASIPNRGIHDGIMELEFNNFGGRGMQFLARDLVKATEEALNLHTSMQLEDVVDHTIFCLPDDIEPPKLGTSTTWTAFTYVFDPFSFYRLDRCTRLSVVAHELGHAILGFRHSGAYTTPENANDKGERVTINGLEMIAEEYGDETGYLGWSYNEQGKPRKAFNAHKHWLSGWYSRNSMMNINPLVEGPRVLELVGYTAYEQSQFTRPNKNKAVLVQIGHLYLQYNHISKSPFDDKWNNDTAYPNQVTVVKAENDDAVSFLVSVLSPGQSYEEINFKDSGKTVILRLCPISSDDQESSSVILQVFVKQGSTPVPPSCEIVAPTDPTPSPVRVQLASPSFTPTLSPVRSPSSDLFTSSPGNRDSGFDREGIVEEEKPEESTETFIEANFPYLVGGLALILFSLMTIIFVLVYCTARKKSDSTSNRLAGEQNTDGNSNATWTCCSIFRRSKDTSPEIRRTMTKQSQISDMTEGPGLFLKEKIRRSYSQQKMAINYPKGKRPRGPAFAVEEGSDSATIPESIEISLETSIEESPEASRTGRKALTNQQNNSAPLRNTSKTTGNVNKGMMSPSRHSGTPGSRTAVPNASQQRIGLSPIQASPDCRKSKKSNTNELLPVNRDAPSSLPNCETYERTQKRGNQRAPNPQKKSPVKTRASCTIDKQPVPGRVRRVSPSLTNDRTSHTNSSRVAVHSIDERRVPTPRRSLSPQKRNERRVPSRHRSISPQKGSSRATPDPDTMNRKLSSERQPHSGRGESIERRKPPRRPSPPPGTSAYRTAEDGPTTSLSATLEAHRSLAIKSGRRVRSGENSRVATDSIRMDQRSQSDLVRSRPSTTHRSLGAVILKDKDIDIV